MLENITDKIVTNDEIKETSSKLFCADYINNYEYEYYNMSCNILTYRVLPDEVVCLSGLLHLIDKL